MSLRQQLLGPVPEETAKVARAAFRRKPNVYVKFADECGDAFEYHDFGELFSARGQSAEHPARLALITLVQFSEGLSDREVMAAVPARIDLKYLCRLPLDHEGFDHSLLSEFRARLLAGGEAELLFNKILALAEEKGLLKVSTQRTDATHVVAGVRNLNRIELIVETMRNALDTLADIVPDFVLKLAPEFEMSKAYEIRGFNFRIPKKEQERLKLAEAVGRDGFRLLKSIDGDHSRPWLKEIPAVVTLKLAWEQQFTNNSQGSRFRPHKELPPSAELIGSPRDLDARYSNKRSQSWLGYKVHLTETCDSSGPNLITNVTTTPATTGDSRIFPSIERALRWRGLNPDTHLVDAGYTQAEQMLKSQEQYGVDVIGPLKTGNCWQSAAAKGFTIEYFSINWEQRQAICPAGTQSTSWYTRDKRGSVEITFPDDVCLACPMRTACTKAKAGPRRLEIKKQNVFEFLRKHRARVKTKEFKTQYSSRAGIEGTISENVRRAGLRNARYVGLAKTHMQNLFTAAATNLLRMTLHLMEVPRAKTRKSRYGNLMLQAA